MNRGSRFRFVALLLAGPLFTLVAADRLIVGWDAHWEWAAREVPPQIIDPYRIEAILHTTPPGRQNVVIIGSSTAEEGLDGDVLAERFADRGLRFPKITQGAAPTLAFGMLAHRICALDPQAVIYVSSPIALNPDRYLGAVYEYDVPAAFSLFTLSDVLEYPSFHLSGFFRWANVLVRDRRAMQNAALVYLGLRSWDDMQRVIDRVQLERMFRAEPDEYDPVNTFLEDAPDRFPNPNTRALRRLSRCLEAQGARLIVFDNPIHPIASYLGRGQKRVEEYRVEMNRIADEEGFTFIDPDLVPFLDEDHFRDWVHANERGRAILTEFMGDYLEENL